MAKKSSSKQPQQRRVGVFGRWYVIVPVALILLGALVFAWYYRPLRIWYHNAREVRVLKVQQEAIDAYNADLRDDIASLETTEGVAEYARRELNLVEKGDHLVIVTRDGQPLEAKKGSRAAAIGELGKTSKPFGAWTNFLDSLFGDR